jgi:hypothetical protein
MIDLLIYLSAALFWAWLLFRLYRIWADRDDGDLRGHARYWE